ncbi:MAG: glycoside hydrolase family 10 protein [Planctomycetota bacterium]
MIVRCRSRRRAAAALAALLAVTAAPALVLGGCASGPRLRHGIGRSVWVDRWDYRTAADLERVVDACHRAGFEAVIFQVRGNGTVYYPSSIEVWSEQFEFRDPGFDPLGTVVRAAHARGMQVHAWVNMAPGWVGTREPAEPRQLWQSRREWFLHDRDVEPQRRADGKYLALNLCLPEVRAYLVDLCREVTQRYDVDGLHLDYIRFPDPEPDGRLLGADPATMVRFTGSTGRSRDDEVALRRWQADAVTRVVADVQAALRGLDRRVLLSAAVLADRSIALERNRQDWARWCRERLVDAIVPMNYTDDDVRFAAQVRDAVDVAAGVPVIVGVGVYKHGAAAQTRAQLDAAVAAGASGIGIFNYRTLFGAGAEVPAARREDLRRGVGAWLEASSHRR